MRAIPKIRPLATKSLTRLPHNNYYCKAGVNKLALSKNYHRKFTLLLSLALLLSALFLTNLDDRAEAQSKHDLDHGLKSDELETLKESIEANKGKGVNVYVIDVGYSTIPDVTRNFLVPYDEASDTDFRTHVHGNTVLSVLKGTEYSLIEDANIHYYRVFHSGVFAKAFEAVAKEAIPPAIVSISISPQANGIYGLLGMPPLILASTKLVQEKGIIVLAAAGNEADCEKDQENLLHNLDDLWFIGNVKRSESAGGKSWELNETSSHGSWVTYYACGTDVIVEVARKLLYQTDDTSYSTPVAAAYIARILSIYPEASPEFVKAILDEFSVHETFTDKNGAPFTAKCLPLTQPHVQETKNKSDE